MRMGIPEAVEPCMSSAEGEGESPAGVPIEVGRMKSSMFIESLLLFVVMAGGRRWEAVDWSEAFLSCAMPLGAMEGALVACGFALQWQIPVSMLEWNELHQLKECTRVEDQPFAFKF